MKRSKKAIISLILTLTILGAFVITAFAALPENNIVSPCYTYIGSTGLAFQMNTLTCDVSGDIEGSGSVDKVKIKLQLQKESDGVYSTVKTWEETFNSATGDLSGSATVSPFSTYRLKATFTAYSGTDSESVVRYEYE